MAIPRTASFAASRRRDRRCGRSNRLFAQHTYTLCVNIFHGRFRIYGTRSVYHGQTYAPYRPTRQIIYSSRHGFRVQCAGHNKHTHYRKPFVTSAHNTHNTVHELLRPYTDICTALRMLLPGTRWYGVLRTICSGNPDSYRYSKAVTPVLA